VAVNDDAGAVRIREGHERLGLLSDDLEANRQISTRQANPQWSGWFVLNRSQTPVAESERDVAQPG